MINMTIDDDLLFEFSAPSETIELNSEQLDQALQFSQATQNPQRQWVLYLQYLALSSFERWVEKRQPDLRVETEDCSLFNPHQANFFDVICHLRVGNFKVCLLPQASLSNFEIAVPRAVIDLPEFAAHFYIPIGIDEELETATIQGFLQYDRLLQYREQIEPELDWNYLMDITQFEQDIDELLLYLQCLEPAAIPLPDPVCDRTEYLLRQHNQLKSLLPQVQNKPLWQVLNWEQGVAVLTHPELLDWIDRVQTETSVSSTHHVSDLLQILVQQATNVRRWIQAQWGELTLESTWQMLSFPLPSPMMSRMAFPTRELRSPTEELSNILSEIQRTSALEIPSDAGFVYRDLEFNHGVRIYGATWSLSYEDSWGLLLVLGSTPGRVLSSKIQWRISDKTGVLMNEFLQSGSEENYLFAQLIGTYDEKFLVTLISASGEELTLPPLTFSM